MKRRTLRCDFCGRETERVRRIALDGDYDRLTQRHAIRYACAPCSKEKELRREVRVDAPEPGA